MQNPTSDIRYRTSSRRSFIKQTALATTGFIFANHFDAIANTEHPTSNIELTVLHTNDVHSRLDPFPMDGSKYQGLGGVVAREKIIRSIRSEVNHLLLLDAGDMFQGTPYFNFFKGEPEMKVMSMLKYDAATLGNHDFDNGIEGLVKQMTHADFPIVNCNYDFKGTALETLIPPYTIIKRGKLKIGILGVGIQPKGLIPDRLCKGIVYNDPIVSANEIANYLKTTKKCDYIICLSHLGFEYKDNKISDKILAKETENIDMILGGHTHTFLEEPLMVKNRNKQEIIINQVGWAGIHLGRINIYFDNKKRYDCISKNTVIEVKETRG
jgi:5'-nucleotidase